jgi:hypothetical protein
MAKGKKPTKSCIVQPMGSEQPASAWTPDKLGEHARVIHDRIATSEQSLTGDYWLLGQTLDQAKKYFNHGQWSRFLTDYGIDKTRASRARSIRRTFSSPDDVKDLTLKQAYEARRRQANKPKSRGAASRKTRVEIDPQPVAQVTLKSFLKLDDCTQDRLLDEIKFTNASDLPVLLTEFEQLQGFLTHLRSALQKRLPASEKALAK